MEQNIFRYAEVVVPLPLDATFTYAVPEPMQGHLRIGSRVVVQFGHRKFYTGIVTSVTATPPPAGTQVKEIAELLDEKPVVTNSQLELWRWIAGYYMCSIGDVYRAALPAGLKVESETFVDFPPEFDETLRENPGVTEEEGLLLETLVNAGKKMSVADLARQTGIRSPMPRLSALMERGLVVIAEKLVERYRSVKEHYVEINALRGAEGENARLFALVKGAPKQETALLAMIEMTGFTRPATQPLAEVTRARLCERAGISPAIVAAMVRKGVLRQTTRIVGRFRFDGKGSGTTPRLSPAQSAALDAIHKSWFDHDVTLLHGVTSSGKTEIYINLIDFALRQGRQALMLVPEIALTTQLTRRLQNVFGDKVVIYHSKFSDNERVEIWRSMLDNPGPKVVIGARSAVFLPYTSLGLVIVDEEHETSYKQHDPAPRYNGRDTAIVLAKMHGAKTLLGSATPSVETNWKALSGRFGLVRLTERYGGMTLPKVELIDMTEARKRSTVEGAFSARLRDEVSRTTADGNQAIIFLNRRGYAPVAECRCCAHVPKCRDCDVTLTYHRRIGRLVCHFCGAEYPLPVQCPVCKEPAIEVHGYGTERLEEELSATFADRRILRMDLDTTRARNGYDQIIDEFSRGKADILVGTQMVTKGLDFAGVSVVGVVNADSMINLPDFKASERAFNMLEQVAGRAGRRDREGKVLIQTRQPELDLLRFVAAHDYDSFYAAEIEERRRYNYPPFTRLINITLRHRDARAVAELAAAFGTRLRQLFGTRVNGPEEPEISRIQNYFIRRLMLKFENGVSLEKAKAIILAAGTELRSSGLEGAKSLSVSYDVDP
ncbi:MAG: primosomal protein N' [Clostridium sp.]|nr:primosomal protein N' [Clostridium sp.]